MTNLSRVDNLSDQQSLVTFRLDQQVYALPVEPIVQIIEMVAITPVPRVHPAIQGVINVRGAPVLVVNLRRHVGLPETHMQLRTPIILVQAGTRMMGLIVDQVIDMLDLSTKQITHYDDILPQELGATSLLQGVAHTANGTVLLLDLERLFRRQQQALAQATTTSIETGNEVRA